MPLPKINRDALLRCYAALFLALALSWISGATFAAASSVCRTKSFVGMTAHAERAERVLPRNVTSDVTKAVVYVEYDPDGTLYYHSNYRTPGLGDDGKPFYPTKVQGRPANNSLFADARQVFVNITELDRPDLVRKIAINRAFDQDVEFLVDVSVFNEAGVPRVDLSGLSKVRVVDTRNAGRTFSSTHSAEVLTTSKPPPSLISKITGCCLYGRPPHKARLFSAELSKVSIDASRVKVASLFVDSGTNNAFTSLPLTRASRVAGDSKALKNETDLAKIFKQARGQFLVLLGHVEGADYVIRTSSNAEQLRVPIERVRAMARENQVSLIDIGCQTTRAITQESVGLGVMTKYNSVDALKSMELALGKSKTLEDFLANMSSEGLKIVVDQSYVHQQVTTTNATVLSRSKDTAKAIWVKVAEVTASVLRP